MLIVSELAEALEAHRKNKHGDLAAYSTLIQNRQPHLSEFQPVWFQEHLKDSVGDELADAYIRICDFLGGFKLGMTGYDDLSSLFAEAKNEMPENFGEALLTATVCVTTAYAYLCNKEPAGAANMLCGCAIAIELICERDDIDLMKHIDLKLQYHATRPAKHGKDY